MKEILSYVCKQKHLLPRDNTNISVLIRIARATRGNSQMINGKTPVGLSKL